MFDGKEIFQKINKQVITYHVTPDEIKQQLNIIDDTTDDNYIQSLIMAASDYVEQKINQDVNIKSNTLNVYNTSISSLYIYDIPYYSIESVSGVTSTGDNITITNYDVELQSYRYKLYLNQNNTYNHLQIKFKTGYTSDNLPPSIKQAIVIKAADMYDTERSNYSYQVNKNDVVDILLNNYTNITF